MPDHLSQRIALSRELVRQGLHEENLDRAVRECGSLAQDSRQVLVFFTLKNVFKELSRAFSFGSVMPAQDLKRFPFQSLLARLASPRTTAMRNRLST
jgi:hypothetical protein